MAESKPEINKVEVVISGMMITLVGTESEEYIQMVARYIDKKIAEINNTKAGMAISPQMKTILISANITDDLFKERLRADNLEISLAEASLNLAKGLEELAKVKDKTQQKLQDKDDEIHELKSQLETTTAKLCETSAKLDETCEQLENTKAELQEFINTFDGEPNVLDNKIDFKKAIVGE